MTPTYSLGRPSTKPCEVFSSDQEYDEAFERLREREQEFLDAEMKKNVI